MIKLITSTTIADRLASYEVHWGPKLRRQFGNFDEEMTITRVSKVTIKLKQPKERFTSSYSIENVQSTRRQTTLSDSDKNIVNVGNVCSETLPNSGGIGEMISTCDSHSNHNSSSSSSIFRSVELMAKSSLLTKTCPNVFYKNPTFYRESCITNQVRFTTYCIGSVVNPFATIPSQYYYYHQYYQTSSVNQNLDGIDRKLPASCDSNSYSAVPKCRDRLKKHSCQVCGKGFKDSFDLKRHKRTHTGVRPYACTKCDKAFSQRCSLEKHEKRIHGKDVASERRCKTYVCEDCGHSTPDPEDHYKHLLTYHPNNTAIGKIHDRRIFKFPVHSAPI